MVFITGIFILILLSGFVSGLIWLWDLIWKAYDKKSMRIPNARSYWAGQYAQHSQRSSRTRGHV